MEQTALDRASQEIVKTCSLIKKTAVRIDPQALGEIVGYEIGVRVYNRTDNKGTQEQRVSARYRSGAAFETILRDVGSNCKIFNPNECLNEMEKEAMNQLRHSKLTKGEIEELVDDMLCLGGLDLILINK